jgi:succinate dehydrogenase hydrophobic anchor subunit
LQRVTTVLMVLMELEYLMMLVIENQEANQLKLLPRFQLLERLFSQQFFWLGLFWLELHLLVD